MKFLYFIQNDKRVNVGLFEDEENLLKFVRSTSKKFKKKKINKLDDIYDLSFYPEDLEDYREIELNGNIYPLSKFEFNPGEEISFFAEDLNVLTDEGSGIAPGFKIIENYAIDNEDLKDYISKRENAFNRIKKALRERGYTAKREFQGSEDGEAISYNGEDGKWFFAHLDPSLVENLPQDEEEFQKFIDNQLNN